MRSPAVARGARPAARRSSFSRRRRVSLSETLDRVLNKGAVISGDIIISVADVDLVYLDLKLILTSVETMRGWEADLRSPAAACEA